MSKYIGSTLVAGVGRNTVRNAHTLLDFKWSDHIINSMEWLRSDTFSWQPGSVYQAVYNHLVADFSSAGDWQFDVINGITIGYKVAPDGHKIIDATTASINAIERIYNATGVAWYYILDTTNERFKLPRENKSITEAQKYVDYTSPITVASGDTSTVYGLFYISGHSVNVGSVTVSLNNSVVYTGGNWGNERMANTCILFVRPGDIISWSNWNAQLSMATIYPLSKDITSIAQYKYLYFYVGQYTQSAIEQTAGLNTELFNGKQDVLTGVSGGGDYVVSWQTPTAANNYTWYRKYKSGWVEQGGTIEKTNATSYVQNLPISMSNKKYTCVINPTGNDNDTGGWAELQCVLCGASPEYNQGKNETSFRLSCTNSVGFEWQVSGMSAQ